MDEFAPDPHTLTGLVDTQAEAHAEMVRQVTEGREVSDEELQAEMDAHLAYQEEAVTLHLPRAEWDRIAGMVPLARLKARTAHREEVARVTLPRWLWDKCARTLTEGIAWRETMAIDLRCRVREWDDQERRRKRR